MQVHNVLPALVQPVKKPDDIIFKGLDCQPLLERQNKEVEVFKKKLDQDIGRKLGVPKELWA